MRKSIKNVFKFIGFALLILILRLAGRRGSMRIMQTIAEAARRILRKRPDIVRRNLEAVFPNLTPTERAALEKRVWRNLGLLVAEFPYLQYIRRHADTRLRIEGAEHVEQASKDGKAIIYVSGHFSNWEMMAHGIGILGKPIAVMYQQDRNPLITKWMARQRRFEHTSVIHKEHAGTRAIVECLKTGVSIGILCDQRKNDGIVIDLFGRAAKAPPTPARLARKFNLALVPSVICREERAGDPSYFVQHFFPPIYVPQTDDADADIQKAMQAIYHHFEDWIRANPEEWLWYHNRWRGAENPQ